MSKTNLLLASLLILSVVALVVLIEDLQDKTESLNSIANRVEIEQLTTTYAWAIDRKDTDALMNIFVKGEPGISEIFPVYDISSLNIPGLTRMEGVMAVRKFLDEAVIPAEAWTFSSISNVEISLEGNGRASGGDYYIHEGYIPAEVNNGEVVRIYNQFMSDSYDLLCKPQHLVRSYKIGQHLYKFIKDSNGQWKIQEMLSSPLFSADNEIVDVQQISAAKKPWHQTFKAISNCK